MILPVDNLACKTCYLMYSYLQTVNILDKSPQITILFLKHRLPMLVHGCHYFDIISFLYLTVDNKGYQQHNGTSILSM